MVAAALNAEHGTCRLLDVHGTALATGASPPNQNPTRVFCNELVC